jgi:hypothetical protein
MKTRLLPGRILRVGLNKQSTLGRESNPHVLSDNGKLKDTDDRLKRTDDKLDNIKAWIKGSLLNFAVG